MTEQSPVRPVLRAQGRADALARSVGPLAVGAAAAAATTLVAVVDPGVPGHYPTCPFLYLTGYYCPGCGGLRAVHELAHGRLAEAAGYNVLVVALVPVVVVGYLFWLRSRWVGPTGGRATRAGPAAGPTPAPENVAEYVPAFVPTPFPAYVTAYVAAATSVIMLLFGVLRNLPWFAVLAP